MNNEQAVGNVVGAQVDAPTELPQSLLNGLEAEAIVEVLNPLPADFRVKFARSVLATPRETREQAELRGKLTELGLQDVGRKAEASTVHSISYTILPSGRVTRLPGNVAQVAVRQLVNYIMANSGDHIGLADALARLQKEREIVQSISNSAIDYLNRADETEAELKRIRELNTEKEEVTVDEQLQQAFPTIARTPEPTRGDVGTGEAEQGEASVRRKPGRPARSAQ